MDLLDPRSLPDDKDELNAMLGAKLNLISDSSHKGQALHILAKLQGMDGSGGGLPKSVATTGGLKVYSTVGNTNDDTVFSLTDTHITYTAEDNTDTSVLEIEDAQPFFMNVNNNNAIGVRRLAIEGTKLILSESGSTALGKFTRTHVGDIATSHSVAAVMSGLNGYDASAINSKVYLASANFKDSATINLQLYVAEAGTITKLGTEQTLPFAIGSGGRTADLTLALSLIGNTNFLGVAVNSKEFGYRKVQPFIFNKDTGAKVVDGTAITNDSSMTDPSLVSLYSYNYSVTGFIMKSYTSGTIWNIYSINETTGAITKIGSTAATQHISNQPKYPSVQTMYDDALNYRTIVMTGDPQSDNTSVKYAIVDIEGGTVTDHTIDLSSLVATHHTNSFTPLFLDEEAYKGNFMMGLLRKGSKQIDFFNPKNLKFVSSLAAPVTYDVAENQMRNMQGNYLLAANFDDYTLLFSADTTSGSYYQVLLDPWYWFEVPSNYRTVGTVGATYDTYENSLGVLAIDEPQVAKIDINRTNEVLELPSVSTVVEVSIQEPVVIPSEAAIGTQWTVKYTTDSAATSDWFKRTCTYGMLIAENADKTHSAFQPLYFGKGKYNSFNKYLDGVCVTKTGADTYHVSPLI